MGATSAKNGKLLVDGVEVADILNIEFTRTVDEHIYGSSSTSARKKRVAGHGDCTGSFEMMADDGAFALDFEEGDEVTIKGYSTADKYFEEDVLITEIGHTVPIEEGSPLRITITFGGNGARTVV